MHPRLTLMIAQQHIADLRRGADHDRLVQAATTASRSDAPPPAAQSPPRRPRSLRSAAASLQRTRPHGKAGQVEG